MSRPPKITAADLSLRLRADGPSRAADLAAALRVDRSTVTRTLPELGENLASFGATRRARYALRRNVHGCGSEWPLYRIDEGGRAGLLGHLEAYHGAWWRMRWEPPAPGWAAAFSDPEGVWQGFPFFLGDVRPQGFLGRAVARQLARSHGFPADPRQWDDDHTLAFLVTGGWDPPGDLVLGDTCLRQALALGISPEDPLAPDQAADRYPILAGRAASDPRIGSSAGGEHPKFLATLSGPGGSWRPVLVKFSPPLDQDAGRRWADLLAMEWHALDLLGGAGLADGERRLIDSGGRRFLETSRFDRTAAGGRSGVVSLEALHATAIGSIPQDWTTGAQALLRAGLIAETGLRDTRRLQAFGELIGNDDMHAGNLAFRLTAAAPFALAPAYDMLPMQWAPGPQGELLDRRFAPQPPVPAAQRAWSEMAGLAQAFWERVAGDPRISPESATMAAGAAATVTALRTRFG